MWQRRQRQKDGSVQVGQHALHASLPVFWLRFSNRDQVVWSTSFRGHRWRRNSRRLCNVCACHAWSGCAVVMCNEGEACQQTSLGHDAGILRLMTSHSIFIVICYVFISSTFTFICLYIVEWRYVQLPYEITRPWRRYIVYFTTSTTRTNN